MGLALGLTGTAGTMAYRTYGPALWKQVQSADAQAADADATTPGDAVAATEGDDAPAAPPETLDTDALFDDQPAPVRKASHQAPARSGDSFDNLADADTDLDDIESSIAPGQSEPADDAGPNHSFPGLNRRPKPGPAARVTTTTLPADEPADSPESEFDEAPVQPPRRITALPRASRTVEPVEESAVDIPSLADDEPELAGDVRPPAQSEPADELAAPEEEEAPRLRFPRRTPVVTEAPAELDDAAPPLRRTPSSTVPASLDEPVADVEDDSVDGYVSVDPRERRALSRIQVMRADNPTGHIAEAGEPTGRRGDPDRQPITPKGARTAIGPTAARSPSPRSPVYLVEQTDTYWSISKKLYGTPRFFQALAEHNRDRVPQPEQLRAGVELQTPPAEELVEQYARFIPAGGSGAGGSATRDIAREEPGAAPLGVASGTPTRRVPDRAVAEGRQVAEGRGAIDPRELHRDQDDLGFHFGNNGEPLYRVGDGDTLTSIAQQHLGKASRSYELYQLNQERLADPDRLRVGTILKLPVDASRIGVVPKGTRVR